MFDFFYVKTYDYEEKRNKFSATAEDVVYINFIIDFKIFEIVLMFERENFYRVIVIIKYLLSIINNNIIYFTKIHDILGKKMFKTENIKGKA